MSRTAKNVMYNFIGQGLLLFLGFISVKYIYKQLGEEALGIIYFTTSINIIIYSVLETSISSTTIREISANKNSDPDYVQKLIRTNSLLYWAVYLLFAVVIYFIAPFLVKNWINLKTLDQQTAIYSVRVLGIAAFVAFPKSFYVSIFRGIERMEFNNVIDVFTGGMQQFGTILLLKHGSNLLQIIRWYCFCYITNLIIYIIITIHFFSLKTIIPKYYSDVIKRNIKFALSMIIISIAGTIHTNIDKLIISKILPISVLGYYGFAYNTVQKGTLLTNSISSAVFPSLSNIYNENNHNKLISQYNKIQNILCYSIVPIFALIIYCIIPACSYILNPTIANSLLLPATFLGIGFFMNGTLTIPYIFSLAVGKPGITARMNFYALFIVLPVTIFLVYFFGIIGAGFSWVFYNIFAYIYGVPRICTECLKISYWDWYKNILKIFILIFSSYGICWIILKIIGVFSILYLGIAYIIGTIIFFIGSYFIIGNETKDIILEFIKRTC